jgi:hypothetical protein
VISPPYITEELMCAPVFFRGREGPDLPKIKLPKNQKKAKQKM